MPTKPVVFEYSRPANNTVRPDQQEHFRVVIEPHNPITVCTITSQSDPVMPGFWYVESFGFSHCRHGDVYDRETGNRLALASALRRCKSKELRRVLWEMYLEMFPVAERTDLGELKLQKVVGLASALARALFSFPSIAP